MGYVPVFLDLRGRPCVVIGGGAEAEGKAASLVADGARVTVVCQEPGEAFRRMAAAGEIALVDRPYEAGDLKGAFLAIAATTHDIPLSERIAREAEEERVLLNVVDLTRLCTWIYPAIVRRGDATVAISTNGRSPAMAKRLRRDVEAALPESYGRLLDLLAGLRTELLARGVRPPASAWQDVITDELLTLLDVGDVGAARARVSRSLLDAAAEAAVSAS